MTLRFALPLLLVACTGTDDPDDTGTDTEADTSSDTEADTSSATDFPDYPSESGDNGLHEGVLWLDAEDGPLADVTYIGSPNEVSFESGTVYSQTVPLIEQQAEITYSWNVGSLGLGEHEVSGDDYWLYSDTDLEYLYFTGTLRIDAYDASSDVLRMVFVGQVTGPPGTSNVSGAIDIAGL